MGRGHVASRGSRHLVRLDGAVGGEREHGVARLEGVDAGGRAVGLGDDGVRREARVGARAVDARLIQPHSDGLEVGFAGGRGAERRDDVRRARAGDARAGDDRGEDIGGARAVPRRAAVSA